MKCLLTLTIAACMLLASVPVMAEQDADEAAVRKAVEQLYAAMNAHDAQGYLALCDESFESPDGATKGRIAW